MIRKVRRRGGGIRESGAFLLARVNTHKVSQFVLYDDLDKTSLDTGYIRFQGAAYVPLWELCQKLGCYVIADVHTHPGKWVGQSGTDNDHPMIAQAGHVSLIVPEYAKGNTWGMKNVGVYKYLGEHKWLADKTAFSLTLL